MVLVPIVFAAAIAITAKVNILGGWGGLVGLQIGSASSTLHISFERHWYLFCLHVDIF